MPLWRGGSDSRSNMLIACDPCNQAKAKDDARTFWNGHETHLCVEKCVCQPGKKTQVRHYGSLIAPWQKHSTDSNNELDNCDPWDDGAMIFYR
jgi:hypothetical protein